MPAEGMEEEERGDIREAAAIKDIASKHQLLSKMSIYEGRKPYTMILGRRTELYPCLCSLMIFDSTMCL
jgi:hypothetical protein